MKTLVVCDLQPDVVQKLPDPRQFVDLVHLAVQGARLRSLRLVYTLLKFEPGYAEVPESHPRLGILRRIASKNPNLKWFTSSALSLPMTDSGNENSTEKVVSRNTFLPQANDAELLNVLRQSQDGDFTVVGYGPTVQSICHLLGDVLAVNKVQILRECVRDENPDRCQGFLNHGLLFQEEVISLVDFLEARDVLHERIDIGNVDVTGGLHPYQPPQPVKYVCDTGRGGHLSLFLPYLLRDHGYCIWPTQPWYKELSLDSTKEYQCPMGRQVTDLCDEPQFSRGTKFFLSGRQHLDEKNLLQLLVPEMMPPTFASFEAAQNYVQQNHQDPNELVWFLKKVNQNGGRAVSVTNALPAGPLEQDDQLQLHVPRPLLFEENIKCGDSTSQCKVKCHIKTYQYIACIKSIDNNPSSTPAWQLYMYDLFYLATARCRWSSKDLSDDAQITTMRTHRLYPDNPWRLQWNLTELCRANMQTLLERAVGQGKLQAQHTTTSNSTVHSKPNQNNTNPEAALQFEVNSADWMLDEDGRMYLIECNGIPVLYDAGMPQDLVTKGLKLYDRLYKENPETAVVNDHDLLKESIGLALTGKLPETSLWKHVATIPGK